MSRRAHFVGSLPSELLTSDAEVLRWFADRAQGHPLTGVPCDRDSDWIIQYLRDRATQDQVLEVVRAGKYDGYSGMPQYRVRPGHTVAPEHLSMGRVDRISATADAFRELRAERPELADVPLQISQPSPLDLALFVFAGSAVAQGLPVGLALRHLGVVVAALRQLPVFTDAVVEEVATLVRTHGDLLTFQIETPVALLAAVKARSLGAQFPVIRLVAQQLAGLVERLHAVGAHTSIHLCYGDYYHREMLAPKTIAPAVALVNRTGRILRGRGVPLPPTHIPCAFGAHPAPLDPAFYRPLRRLDPEWQLIAGVVSPHSADDSIASLRLFETASGRTAFGVATACGLGRCTPDDADHAAAVTSLVSAVDCV